LNFQ